jgi:hypothetical protein
MENSVEDMNSHQIDNRYQQLAIITQLLQMSGNMRHIDEMFLWLSHCIGQRLNIDVLQLWSYQNHTTGQYSAELRVTASQNIWFPLQVVNNAQVTEIVRDVFTQESGVSPQSVRSIFPLPQADLLTRYNLHYWACLFLKNQMLLPPLMNSNPSDEAIPTPLTMVVSLFTQQAFNPNLLPTISHILEDALSIAKNRGLLLSPVKPIFSNPADHPAQSRQFMLNGLIPRWRQSIQVMQANNPLANATPITDKSARQLYFAIDGKKNITELTNIFQFDQEEFYLALQFLLKQKLIQLYDPNGKAIDSSLFTEQL